MTLTFNPDKYQQLLQTYQPKLIKNEAENEQALKMVEELMHKKNRTPEEDELYQLLIVLVEKFEQEYYDCGAKSNPHSLLLFLMEQKDMKESDLIVILGSKDAVTEVINGKKNISQAQAEALAEFFGVDMGLFIYE